MTIRVAFPFVGDTIGGSHVSASLLMRELPAFGFAPVAIVHREGPLMGWLAERGVEAIRTDLPFLSRGVGGARALTTLACAAPRLAAFLRRQGFGLVHANDGRMIAGWMPAARLARLAGVAHARTRWSKSRLAHLTFHAAHRIVAISEYVRAEMPDDLKARSLVVPNPFEDLPPSRPASREAVLRLMKVGADTPVLAFVGTLQAQKRPDAFLKAAKVILRTRQDARFLMIGRDGELGAAMRSLASELGISDSVFFAGFQPNPAFLLAGCDLLLAPAVNEGHGRALVEAMLAGTPVIASASGGHQEIIRQNETGILVAPEESEAMANAAVGLLSSSGRTAMIAAAGAWARQGFLPREHGKAIASLYRALLPP
jgi:glycosyltransferase involved in cell wall biosynthesis